MSSVSIICKCAHIVLLSAILVFYGAAEAATRSDPDLKAAAALSRTYELDKELLKRDFIAVDTRMDVMDDRIDAQGDHVSQGMDLLGHMLTVLTIVITVGGIAGYFTVRNKAANEARSVAKQEVASWFADNAKTAERSIDELGNQLKAMELRAAGLLEDHQKKMTDIAAATEILQNDVYKKGAQSSKSMTPEASVALAQSAKSAQDKPADQRNIDDWNSRAFDAYRNKDWKVAGEAWAAASSAADASPLQRCTALLNLAYVQMRDGDGAGALNSYKKLIEKYSQYPDSQIKEKVVAALIVSAEILSRSGSKEQAAEAYARAVAISRIEEGSWAVGSAATASFNLGCVLGELGRWEDAVASYRDAVAISDRSDVPEIERIAAMSLVNLAVAEKKCGRYKEEIASYDRVFERFSESLDSEVQLQVAKALLSKGRALASQGELEAAVSVFYGLISYVDKTGQLEIRKFSAAAMRELGGILAPINRTDEAFEIYDRLFSEFGVGDDSEIATEIAIAKFNKGVALHRIDRSEEALKCYTECENVIEANAFTGLDHLLVMALMNAGIVLGVVGSSESQIEAFDRLVARFDGDSRPDIRALVARATFIRSTVLFDSGMQEAGGLALLNMVEKYFNDSAEDVALLVLQALLRLGDDATTSGNYDDAEAGYAKALYRLDGIEDWVKNKQFVDVSYGLRIGRAFSSVCRAKSIWGDGVKSLKHLAAAMSQFEEINKVRPGDALVVENLAYCNHLAGASEEEVRGYLQKAVSLGGQEMLDAALSDTKVHTIPLLDESFVRIIDSIRE